MDTSMVRKKLVEAGVRNLKEYGYPSVNADNILTDEIFRAFFRSMLEDNKGKGGSYVDIAIDELLAECAVREAPTSEASGTHD